MIVSDAKREANRRNALKSTGPKTPEGKEKSRRDAIKHGLTSLVIVAEDHATYRERFEALFWTLKPRTAYHRFLVEEVALLSIRAERAQRIERKLREAVVLRAMTCWDDDRRLVAERLGRDLPLRPAEVVAELRRTPQGCDWLLKRWAMLAYAADSGAGWDEGRRRLAFDLLGTPPEFRDGNPGAVVSPDGRAVDAGDDHAAVARGRIASLRIDRDLAAEHDEVDRALAEADLSDETTPEIRRIRRHEATLQGRIRWYMARFRDPVPNNRIPEHLIPRTDPIAILEGRDEAKAEAQDEARPEEAGASVTGEAEAPEETETGPKTDSPAACAADPDPLRVARAREVDARRDARRRKLDRRRA